MNGSNAQLISRLEYMLLLAEKRGARRRDKRSIHHLWKAVRPIVMRDGIDLSSWPRVQALLPPPNESLASGTTAGSLEQEEEQADGT